MSLWYTSKDKDGKRILTSTDISALTFSVVFIAILAAVIIPNFMTYQAKARQSEAKRTLKDLHAAATDLKAANKTYEISDIGKLGYSPKGDQRYSYWYRVNGRPAVVPGGSQATGPCDVTTPPAMVSVTASAVGFVAAAKGNIDSDSSCDE